jgi:hypothetical protein
MARIPNQDPGSPYDQWVKDQPAQGDRGFPGGDGPAGPPGEDGAPGADGADGDSAYQVAVNNGFVGTEAAWLASLVGPPGTDGADGVDGADGAAGPPGASGSAWTLIDQTGAPAAGPNSWNFSVAVPNVDFINLAPYEELMVYLRSVTASLAGNRAMLGSIDNGANFLSGPADYSSLVLAGTGTNISQWLAHSTPTTAARNLVGHVKNLKGAEKAVFGLEGQVRLLVGSTANVNAIRFFNLLGGNFTGGSISVYAR